MLKETLIGGKTVVYGFESQNELYDTKRECDGTICELVADEASGRFAIVRSHPFLLDVMDKYTRFNPVPDDVYTYYDEESKCIFADECFRRILSGSSHMSDIESMVEAYAKIRESGLLDIVILRNGRYHSTERRYVMEYDDLSGKRHMLCVVKP